MVTVDLEKARTITHEARVLWLEAKTKDYFDKMMQNRMRIDHLPNGDNKTALEVENQNLAAEIETCMAHNAAMETEIDAAASAEALLVIVTNIDNDVKELLLNQ